MAAIAAESPLPTIIPTLLGDDSASLTTSSSTNHLDSSHDLQAMGTGDTHLFVNFLSKEEADQAFLKLLPGPEAELEYQQWYHMPDKHPNKPLQKLRRIKRALANKTSDGLTPYYRFPVNDQNRFGIVTPMTPTIEAIRQRIEKHTGIAFNHCVILLYRDEDDCIGFHKDKTLDLDESAPIASVSLGRERPYALRDNMFTPTIEQQFIFPHGALLLLGPNTNKDFYHSVKQIPKSSDTNSLPRISLTFRKATTFQDKVGKLVGQGAPYQSTNWPTELRGSHRLDDHLDDPI